MVHDELQHRMPVNQMPQFMADNKAHLSVRKPFHKAGVENNVMRLLFIAVEIRLRVDA